MTGEEEILHFKVFTFANLKGGAISLGIGALVYLLIVRRVLCRDGSYVNLWPENLDLKNLIYRPVLTKWLPLIFGEIAAVFGENKLLKPVARSVLLFGATVGRLLSDSLDALLLLLRRTMFRQKKVEKPTRKKINPIRKALMATSETTESLMTTFSFTMLMTCIGILIILGTLVVLAVI